MREAKLISQSRKYRSNSKDYSIEQISRISHLSQVDFKQNTEKLPQSTLDLLYEVD